MSMMSAGCNDPPPGRCGDSSIKIDGIEVSPKVSHAFASGSLVVIKASL